MAIDAKAPKRAHLHAHAGAQRSGLKSSTDNAAQAMNSISPEELRRRQDSLMENIGALRFSIARIEYLEGYQKLFRDLLSDCRVIVEAYGHKALVKQIDKALKETSPTLNRPGVNGVDT